MPYALTIAVVLVAIHGTFAADLDTRGTVTITPAQAAPAVGMPVRFKVPATVFAFESNPKFSLKYSKVSIHEVRFPSAVTSPHAENNTVHAEYFLPENAANIPAVIVLDILDGRQTVARGEALWLAQNRIAALVVYMAYYGPRRPANSKLRMLMPDIEHSVGAITQTVLDCRRATAWLAARPELDSKRLGILGTSLGSFVAGISAAAEPRLNRCCLMLGGGGLVEAFYDHPKGAEFRRINELLGGSKQKLQALIAPVDPLTYAETLKTKQLLLIGASRDDIVPPIAMKRLWQATNEPRIVWLDATHVGAAAFVFPAMSAVIDHFQKP